jgi:hypothetical protein
VTAKIKWEDHASVYTFEVEQRTFTVERRSKSTWVVASTGFVLHPGIIEFIYEPFPSNRTDEFIDTTRFKTKEKAYAQLKRYLKTHERKGPVWVRKASAPPLVEKKGGQ